jgi:Ser-tRNA(Ala) deacylase AlaX
MTEKLYMTNAYVKEFDAHVLKIDGNQVELDRTAFYAKNGGQVGDTGLLNQTRVVDTVYDDKNENRKDRILHIIDKVPDFKQGDNVIGRIDWDRRYRIMKNHAASHIMEYFLFETFGKLKLIGTIVNDKHDNSTYRHNEVFDKEILEEVEKLTNNFISENYEITRWEDDTKPGWWYWKAGNIVMPCGGTHPNNTKEICKISIKRKSGGKGKEKIFTSILD